MADITIHGISDEVLERLRRDAEANGQTPEDVARHILTNWHGLLEHDHMLAEQIRRRAEAASEISAGLGRTDEKLAEWKRATDDLKKRLRPKPGSQTRDE